VHAFQSTSQSPSLSEAGSPPGGNTSSSTSALTSGLVVLSATLLIAVAAGVAALRGQWDLCGAVAVAWLLVLMAQVRQQQVTQAHMNDAVAAVMVALLVIPLLMDSN
jgi:hypothetical protein